jgi:hypothetical protein
VGLQIWTDHDGRPVWTRLVQSYAGSEHCDWQSMTFLQLGPGEADIYVRAPTADLAEYFDEPYREHVPLPHDAVPTPYEREGKRLWLSADKTTAYVGSDPADVEAWPREIKPIGCG